MTAADEDAFGRQAAAVEAALADGRRAEAAELAGRLCEWSRAAFGPDHPHTRSAEKLLRRVSPAPFRSATPARRTVNRHITVRYYGVVQPGIPYPLLVLVSPKPISDADLERAVRQADHDLVPLSPDHPTDVVPVLAGCTVTPPRHMVAIGSGVSEARFEVVVNHGGKVPRACVWVQQHGETVANVPLEVRARRTLPAILWGVLGVVVPAVLKVYELDLEKTIGGGGSNWLKFLAEVVQWVPWWAYGVVLLAVAGWVWWRSRPRVSTFFHVASLDGPDADTEAAADAARAALLAGDTAGGLAALDALTHTAPDHPDGWLIAADWYYEKGHLVDALVRYRGGLPLGPASARRYAQAARAAAAGDDLPTALDWLAAGLAAPDADPIRGKMLFNRACYLARRGELDAAAAAVADALAAGLPDPTVLHTDPDLDVLRGRDQFRRLLTILQPHPDAR